MGGPIADREQMGVVLEAYAERAPIIAGDQVIVAVNPGIGLSAGLTFPGARLVLGHGPNGADLCLLHEARDVKWVAERFDRVVVGSGDGIFVDLVRELRSLGIATGVVSLPRSLSRALSTAGHFVRLLPEHIVLRAAV